MKPSSDDVLRTHYTRLANDYDGFLYYSPEFVRSLTQKMVDKLELKEGDRLVDLGCGTAMYSLDILEQVPLREPVIGVDPFQEMLDQIPDGSRITAVCEDALAFAARPGTYDKVLIKEAIHHVDDRDRLFADLRQRLSPGGIVLLVHVPPRVEYPLFRKALERCLRWHADPDQLARQLEAAGFRVERDALRYRHSIPRQTYFRMVESCYMSVLSSFEDDEIRAGLAEMESTYAGMPVLEFTDHFDYLTARV